MTLHCRFEGPWWKRLRIWLFGLTAKEQVENLRRFDEIIREYYEPHVIKIKP